MRIFRRLRSNFITQKEFRNYMLYAVGEIFLVVISILLALQIDNWNDRRKENQQIESILTGLQDEFSFNQFLLTNLLDEIDTLEIRYFEILKYTGNHSHDLSIFQADNLIGKLGDWPNYNPNFSNVNDLTNSGRLNLIGNKNLRLRISNWQSSVDIAKTEEHLGRTEISNLLIPFLNNKISWVNIDNLNQYHNLTSNFEVDPRNAFQHLEFENLIENLFWRMQHVKSAYSDLNDSIEIILQLIDEEITKINA